ncbi:hypothetical protein HNO51_10200 [Billgrantia sulfidoxydans]|uniref:Uncharacterized protein n=1 Tax=Billgrantia sulfidoxydans TaxID=2733484 RepID=A0ABX7W555_9GAMM|nr:hypothetical protein [Halomonas sulfidoxydans]QTP55016.1 hypothetical protein HNO51_10200 [Halomonas sulfidoxydans]
MTRHLDAASSNALEAHRTPAEQAAAHAALFRPDPTLIPELRSELDALLTRQQDDYAGLTRMQQATALFDDLHEQPLTQELEAALAALREGPAGQLVRRFNEAVAPSAPPPAGEEDGDEERPVETVTLGDTEEDASYDDMGDAALALSLSADERNEEYHGVFRFDGSGPATIDTFLSEDPNPDYDSPSGTYHLPNSETLSLQVADETGFSGTLHADAAQTLEVDATGWLNDATLHGASLTEATFDMDMVSRYEGDDAHGGTYHAMDIDAESLDRLTIQGDARFHLTSIGESEALRRVDADTDGEFLLSGFELDHLEEAKLSGGGRVVFYADEASTQAESVRIDAAELSSDVLPIPPGEDTLNASIGAFDGPTRGTAEIIGSQEGQNTLAVSGRDLSYTGGEGTDLLNYAGAGELDDMAAFHIQAPSASVHFTDVAADGELALDEGLVRASGDSLVQTEAFLALTGDMLHPESSNGEVTIEANGEVALDPFRPSHIEPEAYNSAYFARETGDSHWSVDEEGRFDGRFDFDASVTNAEDETLDGLLFEDDEGDLFYVLDTDTAPGIEAGADAFRIGEVGDGWADGGDVQSAAEVDAVIDDRALALLGVGETTLTEHGELA